MLKLVFILAFTPLAVVSVLLPTSEVKASELETSHTSFDSRNVANIVSSHIGADKNFKSNGSDHLDLNDIQISNISYTSVFEEIKFFFVEKEDHSLRYSGLSPPSYSRI